MGDEDCDGDGYGHLHDCDDNDPFVYPNSLDLLRDGFDCDSELDEDALPTTSEADRDGDGYTDRDEAVETCPAPDGYAAPSVLPDCDDADPAFSPDAEDIPNDRIDQDCDGLAAYEAPPTDTASPEPEEGTGPIDGAGGSWRRTLDSRATMRCTRWR